MAYLDFSPKEKSKKWRYFFEYYIVQFPNPRYNTHAIAVFLSRLPFDKKCPTWKYLQSCVTFYFLYLGEKSYFWYNEISPFIYAYNPLISTDIKQLLSIAILLQPNSKIMVIQLLVSLSRSILLLRGDHDIRKCHKVQRNQQINKFCLVKLSCQLIQPSHHVIALCKKTAA